MAYATHKFFQDNGFVWVSSPIITASDCEGAGEQFCVTTLVCYSLKMISLSTVDYIFSLPLVLSSFLQFLTFNFLVRGCRKGFLNPPLGSSIVVAYIEMGLNAREGLGVVLMNCLTIVPLWKLKFANYQDLPLSIDRINFLFFLLPFCHV